MVRLTHEPIDVSAVTAGAADAAAGAVVLFLGTTRQFTAGRETVELRYQAYEDMALAELEKLEAEARRRWPLAGCAVVHRLGVTPLAEPSVAIAVSSPHRGDAFAAAEWLIDTIKQRVPIWKEEHWADGQTEWIHPAAKPRTLTS